MVRRDQRRAVDGAEIRADVGQDQFGIVLLRRLLRDIAEQRDLGDVTTLADATVVGTIRESSGSGEVKG